MGRKCALAFGFLELFTLVNFVPITIYILYLVNLCKSDDENFKKLEKCYSKLLDWIQTFAIGFMYDSKIL